MLRKQYSKEEIKTFIKERYIYILAYLYLFSSVFIFLIGNVKFIISIPLTILLIIALIKAIKNTPKMKVNLINKKTAIIISIIAFWVILGGIGGFIWQNYDHIYRNALFRDLVSHKWPVIQDGTALCYYIGFWLPSAIVGKTLGIIAGYVFQVIWATLGISIAFGLISQYLKKFKIRNLIIFIFYSGLDIIIYLLISKQPISENLISLLFGKHIENITLLFQSSSNTTLVFFVYNQIIPFWIGMMLILEQKNSKSIIFIYALMLIYSPFPLVGLAPVMIYLILKKQETIKEKRIITNLFKKIKYACTFENIVSLLLVIIIGLYFKSNIAAGELGLIEVNAEIIKRYFLYILFEFIIYLIFIYKSNYKNHILNILIITTFLLPFIRLGNSTDFAMRTCIPLAFYIMLLIMEKLQQENNNKIKNALIIILCIGAITPITEITRTIRNEAKVIQGEQAARDTTLLTVFDKENNSCYTNFAANTNSIFYKYISK